MQNFQTLRPLRKDESSTKDFVSNEVTRDHLRSNRASRGAFG